MVKRLLLVTAIAVLVVLGIGSGSLYWAVTSQQPYYVAALDQPAEVLEENSRQLENRLTTLTSDVQAAGRWQTVITAREVNGWLAVKLPATLPKALPKEVKDPRVTITPDDLILAARAETSGVEVVLSMYVEPFVTEEGDLAIRVKRVLAGSLPWPTKELIDRLVNETRGLPIRWTKSSGDTVMIVEHRAWEHGDSQRRVLEAIELTDGEMFLSGRTEQLEQEAESEAIEQSLEDTIRQQQVLKAQQIWMQSKELFLK